MLVILPFLLAGILFFAIHIICIVFAVSAITYGKKGRIISKEYINSKLGIKLKKVSSMHYFSGIVFITFAVFYLLFSYSYTFNELVTSIIPFEYIMTAMLLLFFICLLIISISGIQMNNILRKLNNYQSGRFQRIYSYIAIVIGLGFILMFIYFMKNVIYT